MMASTFKPNQKMAANARRGLKLREAFNRGGTEVGTDRRNAMRISDNGTEFTSNAILAWAENHRVPWHCITTTRRITSGELSK